jgi:hypothetical protein
MELELSMLKMRSSFLQLVATAPAPEPEVPVVVCGPPAPDVSAMHLPCEQVPVAHSEPLEQTSPMRSFPSWQTPEVHWVEAQLGSAWHVEPTCPSPFEQVLFRQLAKPQSRAALQLAPVPPRQVELVQT